VNEDVIVVNERASEVEKEDPDDETAARRQGNRGLVGEGLRVGALNQTFRSLRRTEQGLVEALPGPLESLCVTDFFIKVARAMIRIRQHLDSDIVVVGAGPAGAATAAHAARAGLKVILIDRQQFPRDKVCGDFVGPVAILELERLGVASLSGFRSSNIIENAALYLDGQHLITSSIPRIPGVPSYGRVIPRMTFDNWIVEAAGAAGAQVLQGHRVSQFDVDREGVSVHIGGSGGTRVLRARAVVGADGSSSLMARTLRNEPARDEDRIIAVRGYFEGVDGPAEQADLYFTAESFPGYYWLFPTGPGTANVGVGMVLETLPPTTDHLRELLMRLIEEDNALGARLKHAQLKGRVTGWPLTTYNPRVRITGDRVLLVGDAAGLINSLNGEGIQYALQSGRWAAETLQACATREDFSRAALVGYEARVQDELRYDMALSSMIVQLIRNRSMNPLWMQALRIIVARAAVDPAYADITGGVLAGLVPASSVVSGKIIGGTLQQAAIVSAINAIKHVAKGPAHLSQMGMDGVTLGKTVTATAAQNPREFAKWSQGLVMGATELGTQVARHALTSRRNGSQAAD
jgi:geranylgeranyl reductase family protein